MISIRNLSVTTGEFSLRHVTFDIQPGQYVAIMGKTGSGKTTLLEAICGLRSIESGTINLHGQDVTYLRPAERGIGYVPQDGTLFPTMTIAEHLAFALRIRRTPRTIIDARVAELAALLQITHLLARKPVGLSGGEAQRVSLGRALAMQPAILCLDEPLNALDSSTHDQMCDLLHRVCRQGQITTLHITHNREEAARLADRVLIMDDGVIAEEPRPMKLRIECTAQLRAAAGIPAEEITLESACTFDQLLPHLAARHSHTFRELLLNAMFIVSGRATAN